MQRYLPITGIDSPRFPAPTASRSDTIGSMFDEKNHDLQSISHPSGVAIWLQVRL
ncbi:hypothetical protein EDB98_103100 [Pseudomonas fluorescens]|jgi:hypothetical protein|nr:hypothetical protein EDB98_103100 [Pseudomonas fluorescens]SFW47496.1 hypothetical protein SAMN03159439_02102 [Pseudomonas sp. NFACC04-2]